METHKDLVEKLFDQGILINKEVLEEKIELDTLLNIESEQDLLVLNKDNLGIVSVNEHLVDWYEFDTYRVAFEKDNNDELYQTHLQDIQNVSLSFNGTTMPDQNLTSESTSSEFNGDSFKGIPRTSTYLDAEGDIEVLDKIEKNLNFEIVLSYQSISHKYKIKDFSNIFRSRYAFLQKLISQRPEMENLTSIIRLKQKKEREKVAVIGLVFDVAETKNGHIILTIEDTTGHIKVLINNKNKRLLEEGKELIFDEVIGVSGTNGDGIIFADQLHWPDIPISNRLKKGEIDEYAVFLSDLHVGSTYFLDDAFNKFIKWIRGEMGNDEQKAIAAKIKYIFIAGDVVDGVGIYPAQESELTITSITGQYSEFARLIKQIPTDKQIFICPGNHDMVHLAEPQPAFYKEYAPELYEMENVSLVSNPSMINIGKTNSFEGLNVLMYHGYSFDFYVANVDSIRNNGGYHRADLIMKYLLKRRHLAPAFKSTPYLPAHKEDPLLIKKIPDIMITGHIHYSSVANHKGITIMSGSCWQGKTNFQEKLGHDPEPGRVPLINLKTREIKVLKFVN